MRSNQEINEADFQYHDNVQFEESGFMENAGVAATQMMDHMTSISQWMNMEKYYERNRVLKDRMNEGSLDGEAFKREGSYDWSALSRHARDNGMEDIETDRVIHEGMREDIQTRDFMAKEIFDRQGAMGTVGMFGGYVFGGAADPVLLATSIAGPLALGKVFGTAASIGNIMLYEGASAAVGETITQFGFVQDWEESLGVVHSNEDALINIAGATVATMGLTGLIGLLGKTLTGPARGRLSEDEIATVVQTIHEMENLKKVNPNMNWVDVQFKIADTEKLVKAPRVDAAQAKKVLDDIRSTPQGKKGFTLKKPVAKKEEVSEGDKTGDKKGKGYATFDPDELKVDPRADEAIDEVVAANQLSKEEEVYVKQADKGRRAHLVKRAAMLEAGNPKCKI